MSATRDDHGTGQLTVLPTRVDEHAIAVRFVALNINTVT
jgi:hypothetical protein